MSIRALVYSATQQNFVDDFASMNPKLASHWGNPVLDSFKLEIKKYYVQEQGYTCCYCRQLYPVPHMMSWTTDHIVPRKTHPEFMFTPLNLAAACHTCNNRKSHAQTLVSDSHGAYPSVAAHFLIVHPHFDFYSDHIEVGGINYLPLTDKGEWTYKACGLGRFAEMELGWPKDTLADDRYENAVEAIMGGDAAAVTVVIDDVGADIENSV